MLSSFQFFSPSYWALHFFQMIGFVKFISEYVMPAGATLALVVATILVVTSDLWEPPIRRFIYIYLDIRRQR